jgi:hypothetical protein
MFHYRYLIRLNLILAEQLDIRSHSNDIVAYLPVPYSFQNYNLGNALLFLHSVL